MTMALGGRVSEELHFKSVTSGAHDDFKKVTNIAESMVKTLGMSDKIGYLSFDTSDQGGFQVQKPFSEKTSRIIDLEVKKSLTNVMKDVKTCWWRKLMVLKSCTIIIRKRSFNKR